MLAFDHVIIAVADLDVAADRIRRDHGLASVPGGRHPGHGTGNRIIPLGPDYIELMAVVDEAEAAGSPLGRFVRDFVDGGDRPMALCLRTDDMGAIGSRLGLEPLHMSRTRPDGMELTWDLAGLEDALGDRRLPFFIQWHVDAAHHPGRTPVDHDVIVGGLAWVEHGGDRPSLADRLGDHDLDIRPVPGARGLVSAAVRTRTGEILL